MIHSLRHRRLLRYQALSTGLLVATLAVLAPVSAVRAQISGASSSNTPGSSCTGANNADGFCGSATSLPVNTGVLLQSRYAWNINADVGIFSTRDTSGNAQHNMSFNATAPGGYRLDISTQFVGAMGRRSDAIGCDGRSNVSGVTGSSNIALSSGSLSVADPGEIPNGGGDANAPFSPSSSATIFHVSNGVAQSHSLTFTWNGQVRSNSCEASVRLGLQNGTTTACDVCGYPGSPSRDLASDGHFVTVTYTSLCGNGVVDSSVSEQCDQGAANGSPTSCCTSTCQFRSSSATCRASVDVCDVAENCTGSSGVCPADGFASSSTVCRAAAGVCDVAENCTGSGPSCPADGFASSSTVCRAAAGVCDVAENCTGSGPSCPADGFASSSTVCRAAAGVCDVAENCTGSGPSCPANAFQPATTECRASTDFCDAAENCTGASADCPADAVAGAGTECRPQSDACDVAEQCDGVSSACPADGVALVGTVCRGLAGTCDVVETCDGVSTSCPPDDVQPNLAVCRPSTGICDPQETCDGASPLCPVDSFASSATVCRAAADLCDVAETCTGSSAACPADGVAPPTTVCRSGVDACDPAESCDGVSTSCPSDVTASDGDGDGTCDLLDNCQGIPNGSQDDGDSDGLGDVCDPCTNTGGSFAARRKITFKKILPPTGDDKLILKGQVVIPTTPAIDPVANGVRVILETVVPSQILDLAIPGGVYNPGTRTGWRVNAAGNRWIYRKGTPTVADPVNVVKIVASPSTTGLHKITVKGKNGNFAVTVGDLPIKGTVVIDTPTAETGQCGEWTFPSAFACRFNGSFKTLTCK